MPVLAPTRQELLELSYQWSPGDYQRARESQRTERIRQLELWDQVIELTKTFVATRGPMIRDWATGRLTTPKFTPEQTKQLQDILPTIFQIQGVMLPDIKEKYLEFLSVANTGVPPVPQHVQKHQAEVIAARRSSRRRRQSRGLMNRVSLNIERFAEFRTFITPIDVILAPLMLFAPGAGQAASVVVQAAQQAGTQVTTRAALNAGARAAIQAARSAIVNIGARAASWQAIQQTALNAIPQIFQTAVEMGLSVDAARAAQRELEAFEARAADRAVREAQLYAAEEAAIAAQQLAVESLEATPMARTQPLFEVEKKKYRPPPQSQPEAQCYI